MRNKDSEKRDNAGQQAAETENISQEELLNMDELFDVQGGVEDKQQGSCGLGCFTGAIMHESFGDKPDNNE